MAIPALTAQRQPAQYRNEINYAQFVLAVRAHGGTGGDIQAFLVLPVVPVGFFLFGLHGLFVDAPDKRIHETTHT